MIIVLTHCHLLSALLIGWSLKMAASLLGRGVLPQQSRKVYQSLINLSSRLFVSGGGKSDTSSTGDKPSSSNDEIQSFASAPTSEAVIDSSDSESALHSQQNTDSSSHITKFSAAEGAIDKFGKVIEKLKKTQDETAPQSTPPEDPTESFASMFRKSKFVSLGEIKGRLVQGKIIEVMENDLYIDFGGKFHCVCPRPLRNPEHYHRGATVTVNVQSTEMSSAFLGSDIHVTLLEADGILLGLSRPFRTTANEPEDKTS